VVRARVAAEAARDEASRSRRRACEARRQKDERRQRQRRQAQRAQHARHLEDCRQEERAQAHEARAEQARQHVESRARQGPARMAPTRLHQHHGMPGVAARGGTRLRPASACPPPGPRRPAMSARVCHIGAAARGGLPPRRLRGRHGRGRRARDRLQAGRRLHTRRAELARRMGGARLSKAARLHSAGLSTVIRVVPRIYMRSRVLSFVWDRALIFIQTLHTCGCACRVPREPSRSRTRGRTRIPRAARRAPPYATSVMKALQITPVVEPGPRPPVAAP
jgi:hypothetical protein